MIDQTNRTYQYIGDSHDLIPVTITVERVFEGLEEVGWTREARYDEDLVAKRHPQLREAGWTVITIAGPIETGLAQELDEPGEMRLMSYNRVSHDTSDLMSLEYEVGQILGLGPRTEAEMEQSVRSGTLPASALIELVRHLAGVDRGPLTTGIAERIVSRATWNRALRNPKAKLSQGVADRVERVGQLVAHAEAVWGDRDDARLFITSTQTILGGSPLDMAADSTVGARRVEALLGRIDHGIVA